MVHQRGDGMQPDSIIAGRDVGWVWSDAQDVDARPVQRHIK
jgi:hypothetical protein